MEEHRYDDQMLNRYLLGLLSEQETERFDEMSITDDEFARDLRAVEDDLVDSYARGELSGEALEQFKSSYLSSPRRREKVRFAETFVVFEKRASEAKVTQRAAAPRSDSRDVSPKASPTVRFFAAWDLTLQWGLAAAALLILLASGYLLFENLRLRGQVTQAQAERRALEQREQELQRQIDEGRSAETETAKELERVRESLTALEGQLGRQRGGETPPTHRELSIASFDLSPQTRGGGQITTIAVPATTDYIALNVELESDDFPAYHVAVKNLAINQTVFRSGRLKAKARGKGAGIRVSIRARLLKPQNHILEVTGIDRNGATQLISSYSFRVALQ